MTILEDTRNPIEKHKNIRKYCDTHRIQIIRTKLYVGDYTLPTDQRVCIDTKSDLQEVYNNLIGTRQHERFKRECVRATEAGIRLIVLVEQSGVNTLDDVALWRNKRLEYYDYLKAAHAAGKMLSQPLPKLPPVPSERLRNIMRTMQQRYGCEWMFCSKAHTGAEIIRLLTGDAP